MKTLIDPSEYDTISAAARLVDVPRSTLKSALEEHVDSVRLPSGVRLVRLQSAREWAASERKPGRKPAAT